MLNLKSLVLFLTKAKGRVFPRNSLFLFFPSEAVNFSHVFKIYFLLNNFFLFKHVSNGILNTVFFFRLYGWLFAVSQLVETLRDKPKSSVFFRDGI